MAVGTFMAGRYSATYDPPGGTAAADMGLTEGGWTISVRYTKDLIQETDAFGAMTVDGIYRGVADVMLTGNLIEWIAGALRALHPYGAADHPISGAGYMGPGVIARLDSAIAGAIILTSTASTPAAAAPASLTATYCIIENGHDIQMNLDSKLRKMPGRWRLLPYLDTVYKFYTVT
jgi:hypothetical protein